VRCEEKSFILANARSISPTISGIRSVTPDTSLSAASSLSTDMREELDIAISVKGLVRTKLRNLGNLNGSRGSIGR
jgi:hypothetical protein